MESNKCKHCGISHTYPNRCMVNLNPPIQDDLEAKAEEKDPSKANFLKQHVPKWIPVGKDSLVGKTSLEEIKTILLRMEEALCPYSEKNASDRNSMGIKTIPETLDDLITMESMIKACAVSTKSRGIDVSRPLEQLLLMVTELGEALECIARPEKGYNDYLNNYAGALRALTLGMERMRVGVGKVIDDSQVIDEDNFFEELADTVIRIFSYVGGNNQTEQFMDAFNAKMIKNRTREYPHGKKV